MTILHQDLDNKMTLLIADENKLLKDTESLKVRHLESVRAQNDLRINFRNHLTPSALQGK